MGCNPCCCFSLKDSAITVGIWTVAYSLASLLLFGWQTGVLNSCRSVTMSQSNLQCEWHCPCVGASTARTTNIIEALFVIQVICLISVFFLLFASIAMIYGVHTWSRYLVWPWFPCMISSIVTSLAYCITWWAGDVRDYWLALTIIEIIGVFVNIYCTVVVAAYYRRITSTTDEYEGKTAGKVKYRVNRNGYSSRRDLLESVDDLRGPAYPYPPKAIPYPAYPATPVRQPYSPRGVPQTPLPLPPHYSPYPPDVNELMAYHQEPTKRQPSIDSAEEDPVAHWVKIQQELSGKSEVNSEPISPSKEVHGTFPLQHSRSVPSIFGDTLVSHKDCRHRRSSHHHRSSSRRRRSKSRNYEPSVTQTGDYSSDSDSRAHRRRDRDDFSRHRDGSRRRHRSKSRYAESEVTETTDHHRHHKSDRHRDRDHRDDKKRSHREDRDRDRRDRDRDKDDDDRGSQRRHRRHRDRPESAALEKTHSTESAPPEGQIHPLSGGITIPHHIVIPPSNGERGPNGQPLPQTFQINSEITINYDQNGMPISSTPHPVEEPYKRRPMQITSNV